MVSVSKGLNFDLFVLRKIYVVFASQKCILLRVANLLTVKKLSCIFMTNHFYSFSCIGFIAYYKGN